jgi:hypothetical protein|tara:strand:- start:118 stop:291 length:174 start_codon:yes stop_codon:yes gene_type:complete
MSKFIIKPSFLGKKIMGSVGIINLTEKTSQKDLKKLYNAGFKDVVSIEKVKDEPKED